MSKQVIIYSHGFGVRKDSRGMFADIAASMPDAVHLMFDYNEIDEINNTQTVLPLNQQAYKLNQVIAKAKIDYPDADINLICHSLGCVIAALSCPSGLAKTLILAPPAELDMAYLTKTFANRPDALVDMNGLTILPRKDGSKTIIPNNFWASMQGLDLISLYNNLAKVSPLMIINAKQDEVIGSANFSELDSNINVIEIDGDHNFTGQNRQKLVDAIKEIML